MAVFPLSVLFGWECGDHNQYQRLGRRFDDDRSDATSVPGFHHEAPRWIFFVVRYGPYQHEAQVNLMGGLGVKPVSGIKQFLFQAFHRLLQLGGAALDAPHGLPNATMVTVSQGACHGRSRIAETTPGKIGRYRAPGIVAPTARRAVARVDPKCDCHLGLDRLQCRTWPKFLQLRHIQVLRSFAQHPTHTVEPKRSPPRASSKGEDGGSSTPARPDT